MELGKQGSTSPERVAGQLHRNPAIPGPGDAGDTGTHQGPVDLDFTGTTAAAEAACGDRDAGLPSRQQPVLTRHGHACAAIRPIDDNGMGVAHLSSGARLMWVSKLSAS